ncbi:hypothetical protein AGMMS50267_13480 [Spirochaetia bacterium]|nr:hypothetical protein AGMMS50267_13480 [Spirochaetia bacterium]
MKARNYAIFGLLVLLTGALIAACALLEKPEAADEPDVSALAEDGTLVNGSVYVVINYPGAPRTARTLYADEAEELVNYYEVIFKDRDPNPVAARYHHGFANKGEILSVLVPAGKSYDVLLLAGVKSGRVLLASAFANTANGYVSGAGTGFKVEAGKANHVALTLEKIDSNPAKDFLLDFTGLSYVPAYPTRISNATSQYDGLVTFPLPKGDDLGLWGYGNFEAKVTTRGIAPLVNAQNPATPDLDGNTFARAALNIDRYVGPHFADPVPPALAATPTPGSDYTTPDGGTIELTYSIPVGDLPSVVTYGKLYFDLTYYAFSDSTDPAAGQPWHIRNGYKNTELDKEPASHLGGAVLLIIGTHTDPDDLRRLIEVEIETP